MRIATVTFGCRLNKAETDELERQLSNAGHEIVSVNCSPEVVFVRGCSVTAKAERDSRHAIARLGREHPNARIIPIGCLSGAKKLDGIEDIATLIGAASKPYGAPGWVSAKRSRAFLKVQDGCNARCAYCIIPQFRGASKSIVPGMLEKRAFEMLSAGHREIVVSGCNLMEYSAEGLHFPDLVRKLCRLEFDDQYRIRLGSVEPSGGDVELAKLFGSERRLAKFLHLSVQSASDGILRAMRRPYGSMHLNELCEVFRASAGDFATLGADIICGFPGETERDFEATREFLERWNFILVHAFPYSERPGTEAADMAGKVDFRLRRERAGILASDAERRRNRVIELSAGRIVEILIEKEDTAFSEGWTGEYLRAKVPGRHARMSLVQSVFCKA